jgi:hypothetical protein
LLIACLMMTSLTYSQKLSNDTIRCVPVSTLRHALLIKAQNDQCQEVVKSCRDSITILTKIVNNQDTLIKIKTEKVVLYEKNQTLYDETLKNKDAIVDSYKKMYQKQKKLKIFGFGIGGLGILLGLFVL